MAKQLDASMNRLSFGTTNAAVERPDLLDIQLSSIKDFLQEDVLPEKRKSQGLEQVFKNIFPIEDNHKNYIQKYLLKSLTLSLLRKNIFL